MLIDKSKCVDCGMCMTRCPARAIRRDENRKVYIDQDECVECNTCFKSGVCKKGALTKPDLKWPRIVRYWMSDEQGQYQGADGPGRGTMEAKTNDVTGRYPDGIVGFALEFGRPGIGTRIFDIEKMAQRLAKLPYVHFEKSNPVTMMMEDPETGTFKEELLCEKILSGILEFEVPLEKCEEVLPIIIEVSKEIHTVFSFGMFSKLAPDGTVPHEAVCRKFGIELRPNGKNNVGLGRPYHG